MSIQVEWDSKDQTIIRWTILGRWTWSEYEDALNASNAMIAAVDYPVDALYDVTEMSILPHDIVTRFKAKYLAAPLKARLYLAVGADTYLQLLWNTFTSLPYARHLRVNFFDSLEAAREFSRNHQENS